MGGNVATPDTQNGNSVTKRRTFGQVLGGVFKKETSTKTNTDGNKRVDADPDPDYVNALKPILRIQRRKR